MILPAKGIRIFCAVLFFTAVSLGAFLVIFGLVMLSEWLILALMLMLAGLAFPLFAAISLYPFYAHAIVDERVTALEKELKRRASTDIHASKEHKTEATSQEPSQNEKASEHILMHPPRLMLSTYAVEYINTKYGTRLAVTDSLETVKNKVLEIDDGFELAERIKQNAMQADSLEEIVSLLVMHETLKNGRIETL